MWYFGTGAVLIASLALGSLFDVSAHDGATGLVKERMEGMKSISRAGKVLSGMAKGKQDLDPQQARTLALKIRTHALRIPKLFPGTAHSQAGSGTEASPAIWERWPEFEELAQQLADASGDLASAAGNADTAEFRDHFSAVTESCRTCHKSFRIKKR
jgi:cytochrome c556